MEPGYLTVSGRRIRVEPIVAEVEASVCDDENYSIRSCTTEG